jgi:hypothetical protein
LTELRVDCEGNHERWLIDLGIAHGIHGPPGFQGAGWLQLRNAEGSHKYLSANQERAPSVIVNLFGLVDLIVAIGLGIMTNPGPAQVFHTTPPSELVTRFPLVLVPTFLVPLASM